MGDRNRDSDKQQGDHFGQGSERQSPNQGGSEKRTDQEHSRPNQGGQKPGQHNDGRQGDQHQKQNH